MAGIHRKVLWRIPENIAPGNLRHRKKPVKSESWDFLAWPGQISPRQEHTGRNLGENDFPGENDGF